MKKLFFGVLGLMVLSFLGVEAQSAPSNKEVSSFFTKSKAAMVESLKDPASAKFRRLYIGLPRSDSGENTGEMMLCGEVNAKNSFGGFTGFVRFLATPSEGISDDGGAAFDALFYQKCVDKLRDM